MENLQICPRAGVSHSEAHGRARYELRVQRFLMTSAAYKRAFSARVAELMGVIRVHPADPSPNEPQNGVNRVVFSPEPRVIRKPHPGDPR